MEKINCSATKTMQKIDTNKKNSKGYSKQYHISLCNRGSRTDARISLPISKGGGNPRLSAGSSTSTEDAVIKLLEKIKERLLEGISQKYIKSENLFYIFDNISESITELEISTNIVLSYFHSIVSCIYGYLNNNIITPVNPIKVTPISPDNNIHNTNLFIPELNHQTQDVPMLTEILPFRDVAIRWFKYKYTFTEKTKDNPNPLSKKTLQGYNKTMNLNVIPFFEKNNNIDNITNDDLQKCIDNTNGSRNKEAVYVVLKMIMTYAKNNNYISYIRTIKKPPKAKKNSKLKIEGHDFVYIESTRQNYWLDCFEKETTDVAYLFEGMLLEGFRPEEACGLNWSALIENSNYFLIKDAFKDFPVYNEDAEIIGHIRDYDRLKTDESYRKVPVHPRYREILLQHKENQKKLFKRLNLKWTEHTPIFLNRYHKPYVPENLSKPLRIFREKYNLEYLTPYGLRHSFATFLSEQGMKDIVLMKLMGHADFSTTQKYYIFVSDERKKQEYEQAWGLIPPKNSNTINQDSVTMKVFEQLQNLWIQTLSTSIVA